MKKIFTLLVMAFVLTISAAQAANDYTVNNIYFTDIMGNALTAPSNSCMVNAEIVKNTESDTENAVVVASYATNGELIGYSMMSGAMVQGKTTRFSTLLKTPEDKNLGMIKAYVWDSASGMTPISNSYSANIGDMTDEPQEPAPAPTEKFIPDVITVSAEVIETPRSYGRLDNGTYEINISGLVLNMSMDTREEYEEYDYRKWAIETEYGLVGVQYDPHTVESDIDLHNYLFVDGYADITRNKFGDFVVKGFTPSGRTDMVAADASEYILQSELAEANRFTRTGKLMLGSKSYKLNDEIEIFVNGTFVTIVRVDYSNSSYETMLDQWLGSAQGDIRLIKQPGDSGYSKIFVDVYEIAEVTAVSYENGRETLECMPKTAVAGISRIVIDDYAVEDGEVEIGVSLDGEALKLSELEAGDIIAIATDFSYGMSFCQNPKYITVLASRDKVTGTVSEWDVEARTYTINEVKYPVVDWYGTNLELGTEYTAKLDPFGRIFSAEPKA